MNIFLSWWIHFQQRKTLLFFFVVLAFCGYGLKIAFQSEIQAFPELTNVQVQVITQFQGKAAEEVERQITIPLEVALTGISGLINQRSISLFGLSVITLTFDDDTQLRQARIDVGQRLGDATLPEGVRPSLSPESSASGEIFRYTLDTKVPVDEARFLEDWNLEREFKSINGVADVVSFGGPTRTIEVQLNVSQLNALGLTASSVAQALGQNHANAGGSIITHGAEAFVVRSLGLFERPEDLQTAVIGTSHGTPIRVSDIGTVRIGHHVRLGQVGYNRRNDVVEGIILLRQGSDTLKTCRLINEKIEEINNSGQLPGIKIVPYYDRTDLITKSSKTVFHNIIFGIILVCILLILGLGFEAWPVVLGISIIIPFALMIAFLGIRIFGFEPNLISLGAVDFGIIIETAIFAGEAALFAIYNQRNSENKTLADAIGGVLAPAFLCAGLLFIAFIPILSLQRVEGRIFRPLGITLISALVGGQIGALIFIPFFAKKINVHFSNKAFFDPYLIHLANFCKKIIMIVSRIKYQKTIIGACFFFLISGLYLMTGREFLPQLNEGALYIRATAPPTISREGAVELAQQIRMRLKAIPEVIDVVSQIGRPDDGTDVNGFDNIEIFVTLESQDKWKSAKDIDGFIQLAEKQVNDLPGVLFNFSQPIKDNVDEAISGVKGELVVKVFGPGLTELQSAANQIATILKGVRGSDDVAAEHLLGQPELRFTMNHDLLARYGLRVTDAEDVLETGLMGKLAAKMIDEQGRSVEVLVKPQFEDGVDQRAISGLTVLTPEGAKIRLSDVSDPALVEGVGNIYREQGLRRIAVKCSVRGRAVVDFVKEANQIIKEKVKLPPHYKLVWSGSFENADRASKQFLLIVPFCILAMIVLLYSWFENWRDVGIVLWEIPFSALGSLLALKMFGLNLSISAAAGGVVLIGLSLLSGIMLLSEYKVLKSVFKAVDHKIRGIVISNGVAIVGLMPAAFSHGIGSETAKPFAVAILGGLLSSLIFTLVLLPGFINPKLAP